MDPSGVPHSQAPNPFGYTFTYQPDQPGTEPVDMPTSGPTLLNDHEDGYISSFFNNQLQSDMSGADYGMPITDYSWLLDDHAPTFVGASATPKPSLGQYQSLPQQTNYDFSTIPDTSHLLSANIHNNNMMAQANMMTHSPIQHHQQPTQLHTPSLGSAPSTEASELLHTSDTLQTMPVSSASLMIVPPNPIATHDHHDLMTVHPTSSLAPLDTMHNEHHGGPHTAPARMDEVTDTRLYRFGSDSHFSTDGFQPHSHSEQHEVVAERLTEELRMLKPINRSNNATRASSPTFRSTQQQLTHARKRSSTHLLDPADREEHHPNHDDNDDDDEEDHSIRPRKRRKSSPANPKRKFPPISPHLPTTPSTISKRRRSSPSGSAKAAAAAARENLSEEQKRSNHIQSEQKRRNLIKMGFDELRRIVPELRVGGLSKSMELMEVSNYLDKVLWANGEMRRRLGENMRGRNGGGGGGG